MDLAYCVLATAVVVVTIGVPIVYVMLRMLRKDEAIEAATSLALRELRERFERSQQP